MGRLFILGGGGLFGFAFLLAGLVFLYYQALRGRKEVQAEILSASVGSFEQEDEGVKMTLYRSEYEVRYEAEGRLVNTRVLGLTGTSSQGPAEARIRKNPVGSRRPLYYRPGKPDDFAVEPLARRIGVGLLFCSIGLTVLAATAVLCYLKQPYQW